MNKTRQKQIFTKYFRNLSTWLLLSFFLFAVAFALAIIFNGWNPLQLLIPVCWLICVLLMSRLIILFFCVYRELNKQEFISTKITVTDVKIDKRYNFHNNGGALIVDAKIVITDNNSFAYLLCIDKSIPFRQADVLKNKCFEITYLPKSKFLISIKPCIEYQHPKKQRVYERELKSIFDPYITL